MQQIDFKTFINGVGNDLKTSIDDVICAITTIQDDVEKLKLKTSKPNKIIAQALLEFINMNECKTKKIWKLFLARKLKNT